jgi:hypothetical protein
MATSNLDGRLGNGRDIEKSSTQDVEDLNSGSEDAGTGEEIADEGEMSNEDSSSEDGRPEEYDPLNNILRHISFGALAKA